jgi:hypothetical protein
VSEADVRNVVIASNVNMYVCVQEKYEYDNKVEMTGGENSREISLKYEKL